MPDISEPRVSAEWSPSQFRRGIMRAASAAPPRREIVTLLLAATALARGELPWPPVWASGGACELGLTYRLSSRASVEEGLSRYTVFVKVVDWRPSARVAMDFGGEVLAPTNKQRCSLAAQEPSDLSLGRLVLVLEGGSKQQFQFDIETHHELSRQGGAGEILMACPALLPPAPPPMPEGQGDERATIFGGAEAYLEQLPQGTVVTLGVLVALSGTAMALFLVLRILRARSRFRRFDLDASGGPRTTTLGGGQRTCVPLARATSDDVLRATTQASPGGAKAAASKYRTPRFAEIDEAEALRAAIEMRQMSRSARAHREATIPGVADTMD